MKLRFLVLLALVAPTFAHANDLESQLQSTYVGKTLTLRHFYSANRLRFDADGNIQSNPATGPWTLYGEIAIEKARLDHGSLKLTGRRVHILFDKNKPVDELISVEQNNDKASKEKAKDLRKLKVEIEIALPAGASDQATLDTAIHKVFLADSDSLADFVPSYWRSYFPKPDGRPDDAPKKNTSYKIGGAVSPPRAIYAPDPQYSDEARREKRQGTLVLWLIVTAEGTAKDIRIARPLGFGLDEKAVEAVSYWKFKPAQKDGEPVASQLNVEVTFRLY